MADKLDDPHHLVALMSSVFWKKTDGSPRNLDPSLHKPKFGIVDNHDTNVRTFPVLDALAHISVSRGTSQVVAIGLQLNPRTKQIRLTVAENMDVLDGLVCHLRNVWGKLQALSNEYAEQRTGGFERYQPGSPPMPVKVGLTLKKEIFRDIYQYSLSKQMKRINKWLNPLNRFVLELVGDRLLADLDAVELSLYNFVRGLSFVALALRENPGTPLTSEDWEDLYDSTTVADQDAKLVLADKTPLGCEALARKLHGNRTGDPFQLRRALEKLTSLSRHISTLFGFAHSPRLRPALQYDVLISAVSKQTRTVRLPASLEESRSYLKAACGEHDDDELEASAANFLKRFGSREWVCPVHCECGLIQYLQTKRGNDWDDAPPFSYIGVSKLSCNACRIWIEVFNQQDNGPKFYTRGSHGKWYWPWGAPRAEGSLEEEESLEKKMAGKVLDGYRAYLVAEMKKRERAGSDSTTASSSGERNVPDPDDSERITAKHTAREQTIGSTPKGFLNAVYTGS